MYQPAEDPAIAEQARLLSETDVESRHRLIATLAYHRAELRGFAPGHELSDWLAAEALVRRYTRAAPEGERQGIHSEAGRGEPGALHEIAAGMAEAKLYPSIVSPAVEPPG